MKKNWNYDFKTMSGAYPLDKDFIKENILLEIHNMIETNWYIH